MLTYGPHVSDYVTRHRGTGEGVVVAPQAVEPEVFGRNVSAQEVAVWREDHELGDSALVLFVGRLVEDKGVAVLSDAWRLVGGHDVMLGVVGEGGAGRREWGFGETSSSREGSIGRSSPSPTRPPTSWSFLRSQRAASSSRGASSATRR